MSTGVEGLLSYATSLSVVAGYSSYKQLRMQVDACAGECPCRRLSVLRWFTVQMIFGNYWNRIFSELCTLCVCKPLTTDFLYKDKSSF